MSTRRSNIAKRQRQRRRHTTQRPRPVEKPIVRFKTADLLESISLSSRALAEAIQEAQHT